MSNQEISTEEHTYTIVLTNVTGDRKRVVLAKAGFEYDPAEHVFVKKNASRREVLEYHELIESGTWPKVAMRFRANV